MNLSRSKGQTWEGEQSGAKWKPGFACYTRPGRGYPAPLLAHCPAPPSFPRHPCPAGPPRLLTRTAGPPPPSLRWRPSLALSPATGHSSSHTPLPWAARHGASGGRGSPLAEPLSQNLPPAPTSPPLPPLPAHSRLTGAAPSASARLAARRTTWDPAPFSPFPPRPSQEGCRNTTPPTPPRRLRRVRRPGSASPLPFPPLRPLAAARGRGGSARRGGCSCSR